MALSQRERAAERYRARLLRRDAQTAARLYQQYQGVAARLQTQIMELVRRIEAAQAAGETVNGDWLRREDTARHLLLQTQQQVARYGETAAHLIAGDQLAAAMQGGRDAEALMRMGMGTPPPGVNVDFTRLPAHQITELAGAVSDGTPLNAVLRQVAGDAADKMGQTLVDGLAAGRNPRAIAADLTRDLHIPRARAQRIARTEVLRSYREVHRRTFTANAFDPKTGDGYVTGWIWMAALSKCCAGCLAMNGTVHPPSDILTGHPNCRCTMIPTTVPWSDLGYPADFDDQDELSPAKMRAEAQAEFEGLSRDDAAARFGAGKADAIQAGQIKLDDMVTVTPSKVWGASTSEATLGDALDNAAARKR